jgi:cytochrome c
MAEEGRGVYSVTCSPCHGPLGQGSSEAALIGPGSDLAQYGTAGALLEFISRAMPYGDPGSLTASQYNQVTAFLVVEDKLVGQTVEWDNLADMGLSETQ